MLICSGRRAGIAAAVIQVPEIIMTVVINCAGGTNQVIAAIHVQGEPVPSPAASARERLAAPLAIQPGPARSLDVLALPFEYRPGT